MITDQQYDLLLHYRNDKNMTITTAAAKTGMSPPTARKYLRLEKRPSEVKKARTHRTHVDAFAGVAQECKAYLEEHPDIEAKALFQHLQRKYPGQFKPGQLRTFQRRVKQWRGQRSKEPYFEQVYKPGERAQSDFTSMNSLGITIRGVPFRHKLFNFVLAYSNWQSVTVCNSESFEALSEGLQNALFELGGVPSLHQTDSLSAAVKNHRRGKKDFTDRYLDLTHHYDLEARHTQARCPHENGKVEQSHHRLKKAVKNQLALRGSHDFADLEAYERFLEETVAELNTPRQERLAEEQAALKPLPAERLEFCQRIQATVTKGSTILVQKNRYSVPTALIGERVEVRIYAQQIEVWYAQTCQERMPRLHGEGRHQINYRHLIRYLVRKPGACANYRYHADLFPSRIFRMAYDALKCAHTEWIQADKVYLSVLHLAATESESGVEVVLEELLASNHPITPEEVESRLKASEQHLQAAHLGAYDGLLNSQPAVEDLS